MKYIGLPLACDYVPPHGTGKQHELHNSPTVRRIEACNDLLYRVDSRSETLLFVASAGYSGHSPLNIASNTPSIPLCEQMANYIRKAHRYAKVTFRPLGWGTESEIRNGIILAKEIAGEELVTLVVSTNTAHRLRVKLWLWVYLPKGWKVIHANPKHHFAASCTRREVVATLATIPLAIKKKVHLSRQK